MISYTESVKKLLAIVVLGLLLSSCLVTTKEVTGTFETNMASWIKEKGNANITGQAFLNQQGGGVVTCAGNYVTLTPVNSYSKERMQLIYGSTTKGYLSDVDQGFIKLTPEPPSSYYDLAKKTQCDAQGNFKFKNIPANKEYFITTQVEWGTEWIKEGGWLMLKIKTEANQTSEVILN